jgi:hypothetical protein
MKLAKLLLNIPPGRAALVVVLVATATYANSVFNGFAYDDNTIIVGNPSVTEGRVVDALTSSYWPQAVDGAGLYRPVTLTSFAVEWRLWNGHPAGFHLVNVAVHVAVSLLLFLLILEVSSPLPALVGAALFATHPVHSEAVANVVGRAELYSALFVIGACLLFWKDRGLSTSWRAARLLGIGACFVMGLGSKEMAATLPALLVLLALARNDGQRVTDRVRTDLPVFVLSGVLLVAFLGLRFLTLGSVSGEVPAPTLVGLSDAQRILTSLAVFPQYIRLLVFPLDLVADYAPAVLFPALTWGPDVILGLLGILAATAAAIFLWPRERLVALGIAWFGIAILPVTNLLVPTGVLLAERTLYLPSVGLAFVAAGIVSWVSRERRTSLGMFLVCAGVLCGGFMVRTALRNPSWMSTFTMLTTIAEEHPESLLSVKARAQSLDLTGDYDEADGYYRTALELAPGGYSLLVEVARFYGRGERWADAEPLLLRAIRLFPDHPVAWSVLSEQLLNQGRSREGHAVALQGLSLVGSNGDLWKLVSESYVAKEDYDGAIRARWASFGVADEDSKEWLRMSEIMEWAGRPEEAIAAAQRADVLLIQERAASTGQAPASGRRQ